jgi:hypothetical protein
MAPIKLKAFRIMLTRQPKNFRSTGRVKTPTISRVVKNIANTWYETPLFTKTLLSGNAINPGISESEPVKPAIKKPFIPEFSPIHSTNFSLGTRYRKMLTRINTLTRVGRSLRNIINPRFNPSMVLRQFAKNETAIDTSEIIIKSFN